MLLNSLGSFALYSSKRGMAVKWPFFLAQSTRFSSVVLRSGVGLLLNKRSIISLFFMESATYNGEGWKLLIFFIEAPLFNKASAECLSSLPMAALRAGIFSAMGLGSAFKSSMALRMSSCANLAASKSSSSSGTIKFLV